MKKKMFVRVVLLFLTVLISSLTVPLYGSNAESFVSASSKTMSVTTEPLWAFTTETVRIWQFHSGCTIVLDMNIPASPLASLYRKALGLTGDIIQIHNQSIPDTVPVRWDIGNLTAFPDAILPTTLPGGVNTSIANETYTDIWPGTNITARSLRVENETGGVINQPVKDQFLNAVAQEQLHSLGISDILWHEGYCRMWGVGGECCVHLEGQGTLQFVNSRTKIAVGPKNFSASYDRAGFTLSKIGFIQQMLRNSTATLLPPTKAYTYNSLWTTTFDFSQANNQLVNEGELLGKNWTVDFGDGTHMEAFIDIALPMVLRLQETMVVTEKNITKTEKELLEQGLLCYKVFNMKLRYPMAQICESQGASRISDNWSWDWSIHLWDGSFTIQWPTITTQAGHVIDGITMNVSTSLNLRGYIGWKFKWLRLEWCKAWMELDASLNVTVKIPAKYEYSWSKTLYNWTQTYTFFVGPFPVVVVLEFKPIFSLSIGMSYDADIICGVYATGRFRAGAGWKRDGGFHIIYDAGMRVEQVGPVLKEMGASVTAWIRPSLQFHLALLFYGLAGPYVEVEPYLTIYASYSFDSGEWFFWMDAGLNVNAGVEFTGCLKKILRLSDVKWKIWGKVLWTTRDIKTHDVMITNVRAPRPHAFVGEDISVCVDVLNTGSSTEDVNVTLYYKKDGPWEKFADSKQATQQTGNWTTYNFTRSTAGMDYGNYTLSANATIIGPSDDKPEDNDRTDWFMLEIQDVAITDVTASPTIVFTGQSVKIDVTVKNNGTIPVSSLPVFAYNGTPPTPISDVWCEYIRMVFDLPSGISEILTFRWSTLNVSLGNYTISANTTLLPNEIDPNNNTFEDGNVTVVGLPSGYRADIAVTNVIPSTTVVVKGGTVDIKVTVENYGTHAEIFDLRVYADTTIIQTKLVSLSNKTSENITFTWNTTGLPTGLPKGNYTISKYTISAYATPVPGETTIKDNKFVDEWFFKFVVDWIFIALPGDINNDLRVNILDCIKLAIHWGHKNGTEHTPGTKGWEECLDSDINNDGCVNILDCIKLAGKWGRKWL